MRIKFEAAAVVVRDERAEMDDIVFVQMDVVEAGDAGDVDQGIDAFADAALEFKDQVGGACDNARASPLFAESSRMASSVDGTVKYSCHI